MSQQLMSIEESPALASARLWVSRLREPCQGWFFPNDLSPLHPQAGHSFVRNIIKHHALSHPLSMSQVCTWARAGWDVAELAMIDLIAEFIDRREPLPTVLAAFNIELLHPRRPHRPTGPKKTANVLQDIAITVLVLLVTEQFGLKPTRRQSTQPSACSIVAQALKEAGLHRGDEKAIEKVWQRGAPRLR